MRPIIAVDVDDTVGDLLTPWIEKYVKAFGAEAVYQKPEDVDSWNLADKMPEHHKKDFWSILHPDLYDFNHVTPIPGAVEAVQKLRELGRVIFVTSCVNFTGLVRAKFDWLYRHGFLPDSHRDRGQRDYLPCIDKSLIAADFLIDDGPHNIREFMNHPSAKGRLGILIESPHNRHSRAGLIRVPSIVEAVSYVG